MYFNALIAVIQLERKRDKDDRDEVSYVVKDISCLSFIRQNGRCECRQNRQRKISFKMQIVCSKICIQLVRVRPISVVV